MSSAAADLRNKSRKKKFIAILTLILLLLLVSLLGGLSSQISPSAGGTGLLAAPPAVDSPAAAPHQAMPPRPRPTLAMAEPPLTQPGPTLTPAEEILMEIARYGGSATAAGRQDLPVAWNEPPSSAGPVSPSPEVSTPSDYPWPRLPHDSLLLPQRLAGGDRECDCAQEPCPCSETGPGCPEEPWPLIAEGGTGSSWSPPADGGPGGPGSPWAPPAIPAPDDLPGPGGHEGPAPGGPLPLIEIGEAAAPVPEPATLFLVGTGLACLAGLGRRHKQSS